MSLKPNVACIAEEGSPSHAASSKRLLRMDTVRSQNQPAAANSTKPDLNRQLRSLASIWQLFRLDQEKIDSHFFSAMMKILWNWKMNLFAKTLSSIKS